MNPVEDEWTFIDPPKQNSEKKSFLHPELMTFSFRGIQYKGLIPEIYFDVDLDCDHGDVVEIEDAERLLTRRNGMRILHFRPYINVFYAIAGRG